LYKWEHALAPWEEGDPARVLEWIGHREGYWETLSGGEVGPLALGGRRVDPFDTEAVNAALAPHRLYYGAGYARGLKPTFFIAAIESHQEIQGCRVVRLGRELARDLLALPALSQDNRIILRRDAARGVLWDQIAYIPPSGRNLLDAALAACGISSRRPSDLREKWDGLLALQETIHFHHELGEIKESDFERNLWREIVAAFAAGPPLPHPQRGGAGSVSGICRPVDAQPVSAASAGGGRLPGDGRLGADRTRRGCRSRRGQAPRRYDYHGLRGRSIS
jgi:hypothetical protein